MGVKRHPFYDDPDFVRRRAINDLLKRGVAITNAKTWDPECVHYCCYVLAIFGKKSLLAPMRRGRKGMEGRPTIFSQEAAEAFLSRLLDEGNTIFKTCEQEGMPTFNTLTRWRRAHPWFDEAVDDARSQLAHKLEQEIYEAATTAMNPDDVAPRTLKIRTLQWLASKANHKSFGESHSSRTEIVGSITHETRSTVTQHLDISGLTTEQLDALEGALRQTLYKQLSAPEEIEGEMGNGDTSGDSEAGGLLPDDAAEDIEEVTVERDSRGIEGNTVSGTILPFRKGKADGHDSD